MSTPMGMILRTGSSATNTQSVPSATSGACRGGHPGGERAHAPQRAATLHRERGRPRLETRRRREDQRDEAEEERSNGGVLLGQHAEREGDEGRWIAPARLGPCACEVEAT